MHSLSKNSDVAPGAQAVGVELSAYAPALRRYFSKRAPVAEVDDLVQEVFLNMQSRRAESAIENIEGYLFSVAANVLLRHRMRLRKANMRLQSLEAGEVEVPEDFSPERLLASQDDLRRALAALQKLPPRTRDVLMLHRFEEMTYAAIARRLGISVSAVEKHIMNALRALKADQEKGR
jgi:RNA polymerase sigma factor (sigma-70 family)